MPDALSRPSTRLRGPIARGLAKGDEPRVDRKGGDRGAGLIRGASIIAGGEALGHNAWVDDTMLSQVADAINASGDTGVKVRFTHPSLSGDGLGTMFARAKHAAVDGGRVLADLHMTEAGHETPDGDLAAYVMDLADEDGDAFGVSISFERSLGEEDQFAAGHKDEKGRFRSPDERNKENYRHFRLSRLLAADVVDEPAANPDGLFTKSRQRIAHEGSDLISFALGRTDKVPDLTMLDIDPTRIRDFANRYLAEHNLSIVEKESRMADDVTTEETVDDSQLSATTADEPTTQASSKPASAPAPTVNVEEEVQKALSSERKRTAEITGLGNRFNFQKDAEKFIADGKSVEEFRAHILGKSPEEWQESLAVKNPSQQVTEEDDSKEGDDAVLRIKERRKAKFGN